MGLSVKIEALSQGVDLVTPVGEFEVYSAGQVKDALADLTSVSNPRVCLSLERVTFLDSKAIGVIVESTKRARAQGGDLVILCSVERFSRQIRILKLEGFLSMAQSVEEAVEVLTQQEEQDGDG